MKDSGDSLALRVTAADELADDLGKLPFGTVIFDSGLKATDTASGAWLYALDGQFWEPQVFPVVVVSRP